MTKLKETLFSEQGMGLVNLLFFLSAFLRRPGVTLAACLAWIAYLVFAIRTAPSRAVRLVNGACLVCAAVLCAVNLWALLRLL